MPLGAKPPQPLNWINAPGRVFMFRHGRPELTTTPLDEGQVRDLVEKIPKAAGRRVDLSTPFVEENLLTSPMGA